MLTARLLPPVATAALAVAPDLGGPVVRTLKALLSVDRPPRPALLPPLQPLPLWQKAVCGLTAGGLGALVGSPADLTLIRMQADTNLPPAERRNYTVSGRVAGR